MPVIAHVTYECTCDRCGYTEQVSTETLDAGDRISEHDLPDSFYVTPDGEEYCEDCYHENYFTCDHCGDVFDMDERNVTDIDEHVCNSCYNELDSESGQFSRFTQRARVTGLVTKVIPSKKIIVPEPVVNTTPEFSAVGFEVSIDKVRDATYTYLLPRLGIEEVRLIDTVVLVNTDPAIFTVKYTNGTSEQVHLERTAYEIYYNTVKEIYDGQNQNPVPF